MAIEMLALAMLVAAAGIGLYFAGRQRRASRLPAVADPYAAEQLIVLRGLRRSRAMTPAEYETERAALAAMAASRRDQEAA